MPELLELLKKAEKWDEKDPNGYYQEVQTRLNNFKYSSRSDYMNTLEEAVYEIKILWDQADKEIKNGFEEAKQYISKINRIETILEKAENDYLKNLCDALEIEFVYFKREPLSKNLK